MHGTLHKEGEGWEGGERWEGERWEGGEVGRGGGGDGKGERWEGVGSGRWRVKDSVEGKEGGGGGGEGRGSPDITRGRSNTHSSSQLKSGHTKKGGNLNMGILITQDNSRLASFPGHPLVLSTLYPYPKKVKRAEGLVSEGLV